MYVYMCVHFFQDKKQDSDEKCLKDLDQNNDISHMAAFGDTKKPFQGWFLSMYSLQIDFKNC